MEVYNNSSNHTEFKFHCDHCEFQALEQDYLVKHIRAFHEYTFSCIKCHETFKKENELTEHKKNVQEFSCDQCEYQAETKSQLKRHCKYSHSKESDQADQEEIHRINQYFCC